MVVLKKKNKLSVEIPGNRDIIIAAHWSPLHEIKQTSQMLWKWKVQFLNVGGFVYTFHEFENVS